MENRTTIKKLSETKSWLFEKINKSDKALGRLTKEVGGEDTYYHLKNERKDITLDPRDIKRSIREYFMPINSTT